jgi:hypothetical protein
VGNDRYVNILHHFPFFELFFSEGKNKVHRLKISHYTLKAPKQGEKKNIVF